MAVLKHTRLKYVRLIAIVALTILCGFLTGRWTNLNQQAILLGKVSNHGHLESTKLRVIDIAPAIELFEQSTRALDPKCQRFFDKARIPANTSAQWKQQESVIPRNIFFVHYNERLENKRYLCAIESAARHNPHHTIHIHANNANQFRKDAEPWLKRLELDMKARIDVTELDWASGMAGTPLEPWWKSGTWKDSSWVDQNLGNAFRMGMLFKNGGVYLDLDIVSVNSVSDLGRAVSMQDKDWFNNAVFSMEKEDQFVWRMMEEFVDGFKGHIWARNGPRMVTRTWKKYCEKEPIAKLCDSLHVLPTQKFFPIQYEQKTKLFEAFDRNCDLMERISEESLGVHWWNKRVADSKIASSTVLSVLMKSHCPVLFEAYSESELGIDENTDAGAPDSLWKEDPSILYNKAKATAEIS